MTQKEMIVDYINKHGSITSAEAFSMLGIARLSARIKELRDSGMAISSESVVAKNRFGKKVRFDRYKVVTNER